MTSSERGRIPIGRIENWDGKINCLALPCLLLLQPNAFAKRILFSANPYQDQLFRSSILPYGEHALFFLKEMEFCAYIL